MLWIQTKEIFSVQILSSLLELTKKDVNGRLKGDLGFGKFFRSQMLAHCLISTCLEK